MSRYIVAAILLLAGMAVAKVAGIPDKFQDYLSWTRVNIGKVNQGGAHPAGKDVYTNIAGDKLLDAFKGTFAEGTIFLKERVDPNTLVVTNIYTMEKGKNGWVWGMFERKGDKFEGGVLENAQMCIGCHQGAKTDRVFTQPGRR
ncbi:MAG: cytochrome P460 family protein [Deinococcus sp.]|nr:cytochrome P460 family protein [Deinococcus sp.]